MFFSLIVDTIESTKSSKSPVVLEYSELKEIFKLVSDVFPSAPVNIVWHVKDESKLQLMANIITGTKDRVLADKKHKKWNQIKEDIDSILFKNIQVFSNRENYQRFINMIDPDNELSEFCQFLIDSVTYKVY